MRGRVRGGFEPPAYIESLIQSINDGAKAAQTGALTMLAVAVYLMATVISTTDEVLLRGTFVEFSQLGVRVPVVASYALAPIVFLFLHVHTLIRYDLLAENLRLFDRELRTRVPRDEDQERCRQLLANVEFVQYWTQDRKPFRHSRIFKIVVVVMLVVIPIAVFLATQISFLRYQDAFVTYVVHMGCLALDLLALAYFWYRQARRQRDWRPLPWRANAAVLARAGWFYAAVFGFAVTYLGIAPVDSTTTGRDAEWATGLDSAWEAWKQAWNEYRNEGKSDTLVDASGELGKFLPSFHPLDSGICRLLGWGCRYLRLDHRLLVAEKPDGEVLFKLRTGDGDAKKLLVRVEALFLRGRSLRFADFSDSEFYDAVLSSTDLRHASLSSTSLQGADLWGAQLQGADLGDAQLQGADLWRAQLQGADLRDARLWQANFDQESNLSLANLRDVDLAQMSAEAVEELLRKFEGIPDAERRQATIERIKKVLHPQEPFDILPRVRTDDGQPVLVSSREAPYFANVAQHLTTDVAAYDAALAPFLVDLARTDPQVASSIAVRVVESQREWRVRSWLVYIPEAERLRSLWPDLAHRLLAAEKEGAFTLDLNKDDRETLQVLAAQALALVSAPSAALPFPRPPPRRPAAPPSP